MTTETTYFVVQTNLDCDKVGTFESGKWFDIPEATWTCSPVKHKTVEDAVKYLNSGLRLIYESRNGLGFYRHYPIPATNLRIIHRVTLETTYDSIR